MSDEAAAGRRVGGNRTLVTRVVLALTPRTSRVPFAILRYGSALAMTLAVALVQYILLPEPAIAPFVFFYFGITLVSCLAGRGPGLLAVAASGLVANYAFVPPYMAWALPAPALTATALFFTSGVLVALVCASFRGALLRTERIAGELRRHGELLRLSHDAILVCRARHGIEFWNRGAEQLYGFTADEARGRVPRELLRTTLPRPWSEIEAELHQQQRWEGEVTHRAKDGRVLIVAAKLQLVRGDDGVERVLESTRDITDRKRDEQRLRRFYEAGMIGVLYWTVDGAVTDANDKFLDLTGYSREDLAAGRINWAEMTPPEWRRLDAQALEVIKATGISPPFEKEYLRKDGSRLSILIGGAMLDDARHEGVAFVVDITERKQIEAALRASEERLRESDVRKNEFLGVLSHELRNPLAPIRNSLYILDRAAPGGEQARRTLAVIDRQVHQLTKLTDDLLDVTRISRGKVRLQRERLELDRVVRRTADDHRQLFVNDGIELQVLVGDDAIHVNADPTRIEQVVGNLLQNAAKFTPRGGRTTLSLDTRAGDVAVITVRDTGAGISPDVLPHLFEPFVQAEKTLDRSAGGLGLGLALVKGLVELHGGTVSAHSDGVGAGAAFIVELPLERRSTSRLSLVPAPATGAAARILVIEDNIDAALTMKEALELNHHVVHVAYNGPEGVEKARAFRPDVVICDIGLPSMDGFQVARAVRADPQLRSVALIALSGYAQPEDLERSKEAGFDLHLAKPVALDVLERMMAEVRADAAAG